MEDTLRYFFSALFQGIAAILTLGSMFYMNYLDKVKTRINELISSTNEVFYPPQKRSTEKITGNIIDYLVKHFPKNLTDESELSKIYNLIIEEYKNLNSKKSRIEDLVPVVLSEAILILILSLIGLFCIGYYEWLNIAAFYWGMFCILLTMLFLSHLYKLIFITFDFKYIFLVNLKQIILFKTKNE